MELETSFVRTEQMVIEALWEHLENASRAAIRDHDVFRIGLSGGSLIKYLASGAEAADTQWSKWQLFFCDERYVPEDNEDSTFGQYKKLFMPKTKLRESQFVTINLSLPLDDCAKDYEQRIYDKFGIKKPDIPEFDVLLLGMGPDGHTCSLFPDHPLLKEKERLIAPIFDSPKPPPARVTMTYPLINKSKLCLFAISGKSKAEMVGRVLKNEEPLPAALVRSAVRVVWILDSEAGSKHPSFINIFKKPEEN